MKKYLMSVSAMALGVSMSSGAVLAQDENFKLEEITVTAQKRSESLQDVPIAVTAISGEELRKGNIASLQDVGNRTPGMVFAAFSPGQPEIAIRGIGTKEDGASASDSTVVSIDGVYIAARTAQVFDIFDLERVEVLRGPQGTLYGKNSIGGSINFVTSKPSEVTKIRFRQTVGNYGTLDTGGMLSGAISDTLFGKIAFSRRDRDGYIKNVLPGENFGEMWGEQETFAWRGQLVWAPNDRFEALWSIDGADDSMGATNREPIGSAGPLHDGGHASDPVAVNEALGGAGSPWDTLAETEGYTERDVFGTHLKLEYQMDFATLTSITAYRESDFDWLEDSEGLPPYPGLIDLTGQSGNPGPLLVDDASKGFTFDINDSAIETSEQWMQELRLTSPGGETFDWLVGAFFSDEEIERSETFFFPTLGGPDGSDDETSYQTHEGKSWALYGQGTYNISDQLGLTLGLRYSNDKKDGTAEVVLDRGIGLLLKPFDEVAFSESWNDLSWRIALDYRVNDDLLVYANVSTGFKSGGFTGSASTAATAATPFGPEEATNYEFGFKSDLFDSRLRLNATMFYTDYKDLQVTRFFQPVGSGFGEFITENAGEAEIKGLEIEWTALLTRSLVFGGSYAYLDAKYTKFQGTPSAADPDANFDGNRLRQAPKHSFNAYAEYTFDLGDKGEIAAKLDWRYQGHSFYDADNNDLATIPSYDIWDARVAWMSADGRYELAAWGQNIGNEKYRTHVFTQRGSRIAFAQYGMPRTYGLTFTYNY
ncbi:TonB-dependent receptor [Kordiimonas sediminis]|uniref:TonB-dependent receptor n=1 Tax=Kordiimonas sediminis TaxID=1735581 RepID=A0A919AP01_9PROT|nr:TonB-dependent receptor [Kordiimonas sediminis]GHF18010.1 TonB-dependent receptor [Kordiimonas sediminis]